MAIAKESINLRKVIMHVLDQNTGEPILADDVLEYGSELSEFFKSHIANIFGGDDSKRCEFYKQESDVYRVLDAYDDDNFVQISKDLAITLYDLMRSNVDIMSADLFVIRFQCDSLEYLGILKMNYKAMYTHRSIPEDGKVRNELFRYKELLPAETTKLSEAAIIRLTDLAVWIVEKKAEINGKKEEYFSQYYLKCSTKLSNKKKLQMVSHAIESVNNAAFEEQERFEPMMEAKAVMHKVLENNGGFVVEELGDEIFKSRPDLRDAYQERIEKYNLVKEEVLPESEHTTRKYEKQSLVTDNGIEIKIPMDLYNQEGIVEFKVEADQTTTLTIRNVNVINAKM